MQPVGSLLDAAKTSVNVQARLTNYPNVNFAMAWLKDQKPNEGEKKLELKFEVQGHQIAVLLPGEFDKTDVKKGSEFIASMPQVKPHALVVCLANSLQAKEIATKIAQELKDIYGGSVLDTSRVVIRSSHGVSVEGSHSYGNVFNIWTDLEWSEGFIPKYEPWVL